jgi:hypothetical protein
MPALLAVLVLSLQTPVIVRFCTGAVCVLLVFYVFCVKTVWPATQTGAKHCQLQLLSKSRKLTYRVPPCAVRIVL